MNVLKPFFDDCQAAFGRVESAQAVIEHSLIVAGCRISLRVAGQGLVSAMLPALAHLKTSIEQAMPDITFCLWEAVSTGIYPPRPPFAADDYHRYGQRALADDGQIALMHAPTAGTLFAYDRMTRRGFFWTPDAAALSIYERAAPLQTLFHWALKDSGWQIVHAAAVGTTQGGVLLVGNTGAGKSTTALACLGQSGLQYLCDDKCLATLSPSPRAFALFSSAKLNADMLGRLPHMNALVAGWDSVYKVGKGMVYLHPTYRDEMVAQFPIQAILIPRVAHQSRPSLRPATANDVFRVLAPSTAIWLPGVEADSFRFMAALVRQVDRYWLDLSPNLMDNIGMIEHLLAGHR